MPKKIPNKLDPHHPHARKTAQWYQMTSDHIFEIQKSRVGGLTEKEVAERLKKYGPNALPKADRLGGVAIFFNQFKSPLVYILLIAAIISLGFAFFHHSTDYIDAIVISVAVFINVVIGFFQERKAQRALEALQEVVTAETTVVRDGERQRIDIRDLVPGDVVEIGAGDKIPADCRLVEVTSFLVEEAALTGESKAVAKNADTISEERILAERENMAYLGTVAVLGQTRAVVVSTGIDTQIGKIAEMVAGRDEDLTPLQKKLEKFSKKLSYIVLGISIFIFVLGVFTTGTDLANMIVMFETAVAVAVAAIPEGLVIAVTIVLAVGMQRILKEHALVRKLLAAETLGSTTVICTDKTGTLTEGKMRVAHIVTVENTLEEFDHSSPNLGKEDAEEFALLLRIGMLCNDAFSERQEGSDEYEFQGMPTESALLQAAVGVGLDQKQLNKETPRLDTVPFDSSSKYMATLHKFSKDEQIVYLKGAPERVLDFCDYVYTHTSKTKHKKITKDIKEKIQKQYETMSRQGLRVLALAYRKEKGHPKSFKDISAVTDQCVFVGFVGIKDPLRQSAKETVDLCKKAGVEVVMITGDHALTARAIGFELGLKVDESNVLEGVALREMTDTELQEKVQDIKVYARVSPEDKLRIVNAWQARGQVVAMTGDGVNDAPALKKADIGVALGSGTEVAKETADLVLLDNRFSTIVTAVKEGRVIYDNIKKIVLYLLSDSFAEVILIILALIFGWPIPLLVAQILYINLINDSLPALALTQESAEKSVMEESPHKRDKPILDTEHKAVIGFVSGISALAAIVVFWYILDSTGDIVYARTMAFTTLAIKSIMYVFSIRSLKEPLLRMNPLSNKYLLMSVVVGIGLQLLALYTPFFNKILQTVPLTASDWGIVLLACAVIIIMLEMIKALFRTKLFASTEKV